MVNGSLQTNLSPNPPGITVPDLSPNSIATIVFKLIVNTIPSPNRVTNQGKVTYSFFTITVPKQIISNNVVTTINMAQVAQSKQVSKNYCNVGDILTYTIPITNSGNVTANNVTFIDTIPSGTTFVPDSVFINNVQQPGANPGTGIAVPNIGPGAITTITFQVRVVC